MAIQTLFSHHALKWSHTYLRTTQKNLTGWPTICTMCKQYTWNQIRVMEEKNVLEQIQVAYKFKLEHKECQW